MTQYSVITWNSRLDTRTVLLITKCPRNDLGKELTRGHLKWVNTLIL